MAPPKMQHTLAPHLLLIMHCNDDSGMINAGIMATLTVAEIEVYSGDRVQSSSVVCEKMNMSEMFGNRLG